MLTDESIHILGEELLADPIGSSNNAIILLRTLKDLSNGEDNPRAAIRALQLFFSDWLSEGQLSTVQKKLPDDAASVAHTQWLARQYKAFQDGLLAVLSLPASPKLQLSALTAILELARANQAKAFEPELFCVALETIICSRHTSGDLLAVIANSFAEYCDLRFYIFRIAHSTASKAASNSSNPDALKENQASSEQIARNIYTLLSQAKPLATLALQRAHAGMDAEEPVSSSSWCGALERESVKPSNMSEGPRQRRKRQKVEAAQQHSGADEEETEGNGKQAVKWVTPFFQKKAFSEAWLAFFRMQLPDDVFRKALVRVHEQVIPHLSNSHLLADLMTGALDSGGLLGMLALHAIFVLVTKYGLEYPHFYARLYQLLQPDTLLAKHRSRFFQLADIFLSSQLVPAYTMTAFAKRFSRLALTSNPAGAMLCLAFVHNILRRHRACNVLVNRAVKEDATTQAADPYIDIENDPSKSRALESSLWEVKSLCDHYYVQVAVIARQILDKDLSDRKKTAELDIAPMLAGSYHNLVLSELNRRIKHVSSAFYRTPPTKLFGAYGGPEFAAWSF